MVWFTVPASTNHYVEFNWMVKYSIHWSNVIPSETVSFDSKGHFDIKKEGNILKLDKDVMKELTVDPTTKAKPEANQVTVYCDKNFKGVVALAMSNKPMVTLLASDTTPLKFIIKPPMYFIRFSKDVEGTNIKPDVNDFAITSLLHKNQTLKLKFDGETFSTLDDKDNSIIINNEPITDSFSRYFYILLNIFLNFIL